MATGKRYYWIKLKDTFLTSDTVDYFMGLPDGANYVVLYQMLCLKTINTDGRFERRIGEMIIPYDIEKIQRDCKYFGIDTIRCALELYRRFGLVYEDNDGVLVITDHDNLVGSETDYARQKRLQRKTEDDKKAIESDADIYVDIDMDNSVDIVHTDIRDKDIRERDKDKDKNKNILSGKVAEVVEYLNMVCGTRYRHNTDSTRKHIIARLNEGYDVEDFKTVIDKKYKSWKGKDMEKYLRPETLFGPKFEGYLNEHEKLSRFEEVMRA